jgi:hypothetical protein
MLKADCDPTYMHRTPNTGRYTENG